MYFEGGIKYIDAVERFDYLKDNEIVGPDLLTMTYELMLYSHDARIGNVIIFDIYQTNAGILKTNLDV